MHLLNTLLAATALLASTASAYHITTGGSQCCPQLSQCMSKYGMCGTGQNFCASNNCLCGACWAKPSDMSFTPPVEGELRSDHGRGRFYAHEHPPVVTTRWHVPVHTSYVHHPTSTVVHHPIATHPITTPCTTAVPQPSSVPQPKHF